MKKKQEPPENLERWMVSYADFMTLLFALFVVLYSFAMAKQSELQAMAQSIAESFETGMISQNGGVLVVPDSVAQQLQAQAEEASEQGGAGDTKAVVQNGGMIMNFQSSSAPTPDSNEESENDNPSYDEKPSAYPPEALKSSGDLITSENPRSKKDRPHSDKPTGGSDAGQGGMSPGGMAEEIGEGGRTPVETDNVGEGVKGNPFDAVRESISMALSEVGVKDHVDIEQNEHWLTISINSGMLFAEGSASILSASKPIIGRIALVLTNINNYIRVRGYTDNTFIPDGIYKNSWDLSASRAVNVLHELEEDGIDSRRLAAEAYGEFSPFFSNSTPAGRAQNRRVVIAISRYAMSQSELQVTNDMNMNMYQADGGQSSSSSDNSGGYVPPNQRAGSGAAVDIVHGEGNTIMLDFSN
ncbi:MAG: OmpA family protein [Succinivibrio sp.]|nr:OmpA family protein [Succinivibrio sp.]